ncbi:MAG: InlB B-repeat-containing protein, partial [Clostridia bacterium]|nr:InlB B-repeat-containing protein [Clostridia bacterium]
VTAMGNAVSTDKNLIAMAGVSINGVKLTDIDGASITYMHGDNHMGIDVPASAIYPTQEYPITILKVEAGTVFENYELPEIILSLIGGTWVVGEFERMPEEEYVTISDIAGEERVSLGAEGLLSAMDGFEGDVNFKFVYRSDEAIVNYAPFGGLAVYLNSTNSWDGWRIFFVGNVVYVYDATMGGTGEEHVLIGQAEFGIASSFEMQIEISIKQVDGKYSIAIGGSCAKILEINDITPIGECIGGGISLYSAMRSCSVKDYKYGDVFDPVLTIHSKQEIVLNEGDEVPEIDATAVDGLMEITPNYVWDEGAITDGKMNVGVWNCVVTATDANGNYSSAIVRVTVKGEPKFTVTFDGKDEVEYAYGEKIVKPLDPTKEATVKLQYTFDGWYNGDEKWDFDHDIVTSDVALVAKFIEKDVYYKVTVTVEGETQVVYLTYGAQLDLNVFNKEGFTKEVKQNGQVITSLIVTKDTAIEIAYTQFVEETQEGGCAGSLTGFGCLGVLLATISGYTLMRKKEETDEK